MDATTTDYTKHAVGLVEMGDRHAFENLCREAIKQFGKTTEPNVAEQIVKNSLHIPPSASLLAALSPLAEAAAKSVHAKAAAGNWPLPWRSLTLARRQSQTSESDSLRFTFSIRPRLYPGAIG